MTQEVLIRVFPGIHTRTEENLEVFFLQGLWRGKLRMAVGWPGWRCLPGWRWSEAGTEREEMPCGVRERKETGKERRDLVRGHRASLRLSAECSAYRRSLALPHACGLLCKTHSSVRRGQVFLVSRYRLWDIIGAQWIFIWSMKNDGWVSEWLWEQKNHTEETLSPRSN